jgi:tripartite-type tricarboxylate transporter receptor subunit TctC
MEFLLTGQAIGNPFFAAPGIPQDRAALLKTAFMRAVSDPGFAADAQKQLLVVGPISGDQLLDILQRAYSTAPALRKRAQDIYNAAQN